MQELIHVLNLINAGYYYEVIYTAEQNTYFIRVDNPEYSPDNGKDMFKVVEIKL